MSTPRWVRAGGLALAIAFAILTSQPAYADSPLQDTTGQPCHDTVSFVGVRQWATPNGCFGTVYRPSATLCTDCAYPGFCNWWPEVLHPLAHDVFDNPTYLRGHTAHPGDAIYFYPNEQGAGPRGHFAQVVALPEGSTGASGWMLVTEMNFDWRGAGYWRVDYRYVRITAGMEFIYTARQIGTVV